MGVERIKTTNPSHVEACDVSPLPVPHQPPSSQSATALVSVRGHTTTYLSVYLSGLTIK